MRRVARVVKALREAGCRPKRTCNGYRALCPVHDDHSPSLDIGEGEEGRCLIGCHAGCETEKIVEALGLQMSDLGPDPSERRPDRRRAAQNNRKSRGNSFQTAKDAIAALEKKRGRLTARYKYADPEGNVVGWVLRWDDADGKTFRPVSLFEDGWRIRAMPTPRSPYRLPRLPDAEQVFVVEGEKCVRETEKIGLTATTSACGSKAASKTDWSPLAGRKVFILPDNDPAGRKYAEAVATELSKLLPQPIIKIVELPGLPPNGDIVQFIEAKGTKAQAAVENCARTASIWTSKEQQREERDAGSAFVFLSDMEPEPVDWLWPHRIARGKVTLLAGDPDVGKSLVATDIAGLVSTGHTFPGCSSFDQSPGGVVFLSAEDSLKDTVLPRLDAAGADTERIAAIPLDRGFRLTDGLWMLEETINAVSDCRLVVIDPISAYLGNTDSHKNADVRAVLSSLTELAARYGVAVLAINHLRKGEGRAMYRLMGSVAFVAAARAAYAIVRDEDGPKDNRRFMLPIKNNLDSDRGGLAFRIEATEDDVPFLVWESKSVSVSADELLGPQEPRSSGPEPRERNRAADWLRGELADGPRPQVELLLDAEIEGISEGTLKRAKKSLGVVSEKDDWNGGWTWRLPEELE